MLYLIGPDGLVNQGYGDFHKKVYITMVIITENFHSLILNLGMHIYF